MDQRESTWNRCERSTYFTTASSSWDPSKHIKSGMYVFFLAFVYLERVTGNEITPEVELTSSFVLWQ